MLAMNRILPLGAPALVLLLACSPGGERRPGRDGGPVTTPLDSGPAVDAETPPPRDFGPRPESCGSTPGMDVDGDGFPNGEDCNDCSAQINPGAFDEPGNGADEDCSGADETATDCDTSLPIAGSAEDAARAMGLCRLVGAGDSGWGVVSARYTKADGTGSPRSPLMSGVLPSLGSATPISGGALFALSSGVARAPSQSGYTGECDTFGIEPDFFTGEFPASDESFPPGFPVSSTSCPGVTGGAVYNSSALELQIRVPTNALGFRFTSNFYTYEYPNFICDEYNDFFAVLRQNASGGWDNIVFDLDGNAVSVNNSFLQVCTPGTHGGKTFACPLGRTLLGGTGYDGSASCGQPLLGSDPDVGAATGWLQTTAAVVGGETLTLRFIVWDSGDPVLDSTALLDAFEWELDEIVNEDPVTTPLI